MHNYPAYSKFYHPPWEKYEERCLYEATLELGDLGSRECEVEYIVTKQEGRPCSVELLAVRVSDLFDQNVLGLLTKRKEPEGGSKSEPIDGAKEHLEREVLEAEIMYWEGRK